MPECLLDTPCGRIRGETKDGCRIFRGIPYAATARFEKPVETTRWDGVLDAVPDGADCYQFSAFRRGTSEADHFYDREFRSGLSFTYTEEDVTLNIVAPENAANCPVLVFVHGGGHETGTVSELPYGTCTEYAGHGIVYVSVGYRLNVFSLFRCRNFGLFDLLAALSWLQHNLAAFGGDGARMTVIGQSAGAMSLTDLCLTPLAAPYLRGAVLMSGGGAVPHLLRPCTKEEADPYWDRVRAAAGVQTDEALNAVPPQTLWEAWYRVRTATRDLRLLQPGIDGEIIRGEPGRLLKAGAPLPIPCILGVTSQDFLPVFLYEMALRWGKAAAAQGRPPVYGYLFDHTLPGSSYKAWHACDLWYLFGSMDRSWRPFTEADRALSQQMIAQVAQFVKTGDPNGAGLPAWKPITQTDSAFRRFDTEPPAQISPAGCRAKVWRTALFDKGPM
jgi:carboxylesterase type B